MVVTDGAQTTHKGSYTPLDKASQPIKDKGIDVWAIGVGKWAKKEELETIASDPGKVIVVKGFKDLKYIIETLQKGVCKGIQSTFL